MTTCRPAAEDYLETPLGAPTLEQKVRLLTGANFWTTHAEPEIG